MKRTLLIKLLLSYVLFFIAAFIVLCTYTQHQTTAYIEKTESQQLYREATILSSNYATAYYQDTLSVDELQTWMSTFSHYLDADIWIVTPRGEIVLQARDSAVSRNVATTGTMKCIEGFDASDFGNRYYKIGKFYGLFHEDVLTVFYPIIVGYRTLGYILIHKPVSTITQNVNGFMNISFFTVGIIFLCSFVILLAFTFFIYWPLRKINSVARQYADGNFAASVNVHTTDEIGYLANTMNFMAKELGTMEDDQRKFISNVSHDFRSPLTSIKGYVEAMIDGTIPVEMQEKYLNIILFETERLNKLTQSLIDLNRFGHHGILLDVSDFDINNMIRNTLLSFEGRCSEKNITFDLVLTGHELFVTADMSKIQQVVHNLVDNAVKFSHQDSSIKIETSVRNEKVFVSVKDSGIGIPNDSIKKIWERFYKTDLSRGKDKRGTGLGLSIVKEIVNAHNENINVISTEGVGTEFIFTLPLSSKESKY